MKVLYAKGGRAIAEAERLFPLAGTAPQSGPDQFLLSVLSQVKDAAFQLVSLGPKTGYRLVSGREAFECGAWPTTGPWWLRKLIYLRESLRFMIKAIRWKPTHVLCGIEGPFAVMALWVARWSHARFVFLDHVALDLPSISRVNRAAHRIVVKHADALIVHGPFLRDQVIGLGAQENNIFEFDTGCYPQSVGGNGISCANADPVEERLPALFVYIGRIEEDKGVFDLLEAFSAIRHKHVARLTFVGDGSALETLKRVAKAAEYPGSTEILGSIPHAEISTLLSQALAVVTPTQSRFPEGRCMSAIEAFVVGTPVIAPDFGPFPYLVTHRENGLLYVPNDVASLADAMSQLLLDTTLRDTVRVGARASGEKLAGPHKSFEQAVQEAAFNFSTA